MPALEPTAAWRVVASAGALDAARWQGDDVQVLRVAPDEALGMGATGVELSDADAIVEPEAGISIARLTVSELRDVVAHVEWGMPRHDAGVGLAQGKVAGVPAKLWTGEPALLVVQTCYVDDLRTRLRW